MDKENPYSSPVQEHLALYQDKELLAYAMELIDQGYDDPTIDRKLIERGVPENEAGNITDHCRIEKRKRLFRRAKRDMIVGSLIFLVAFVASAASFLTSLDPGAEGRTVKLHWQAILIGTLVFARGFGDWRRAKADEWAER